MQEYKKKYEYDSNMRQGIDEMVSDFNNIIQRAGKLSLKFFFKYRQEETPKIHVSR